MDEYGTPRRFSKAGMFFIGFFSGLLAAAVLLVVSAGYVFKHPQIVLTKAGDFGIRRVFEKTVESAPREYIGQKQDEIAVTAQKFAKAFSESRISPADMQLITVRLVSVMADQKITPDEVDETLRMMNRFATRGNAE
ncbi:MAG TPA: hypothetical protein VGB38_06670 [bacterium]